MIQISGQYGDVICGDVFGPMHGRLNEIFESSMRQDYGTKVTMLCIILRVSGELWDFGTAGPERLFYRRKGKYLEIDLAIPRRAWEERPLKHVRQELADGLRATFAVLKERLVRTDKKADIEAWETDFERCLNQFANEGGAREVERKYTSPKAREAWRQRIRRFSSPDD